jgi:hypothetical protein
MISCVNHQCAHCRSPIASDQRWVREKIYDPAPNGRDPRYYRYHAEPFAGEDISCWEKHQLEKEIARTNSLAA